MITRQRTNRTKRNKRELNIQTASKNERVVTSYAVLCHFKIARLDINVASVFLCLKPFALACTATQKWLRQEVNVRTQISWTGDERDFTPSTPWCKVWVKSDWAHVWREEVIVRRIHGEQVGVLVRILAWFWREIGKYNIRGQRTGYVHEGGKKYV